MKKPALICLSLIFACSIEYADAQLNVNTVSVKNTNEIGSSINGISFTPEGILKNPPSGGTKSVKVLPVPVVTKAVPTSVLSVTSAVEKLSALQYKYAMMLKVDVESLKNVSLLGFIEDWFGTKYRYGGTTKKGIDCSALTGALLLAVYGFNLPRTARQQYDATEHISKDELKEGDLVFFNTHGGVSHVGVYLENNYFVEASTHGVKISSLDDRYYSKRFICGGRVTESDLNGIN
jgi:hypothetical protein